MWTILAILAITAVIGLALAWWLAHRSRAADAEGDEARELVPTRLSRTSFKIPAGARVTVAALVIVAVVVGLFNQMFFYAEPGYVYHVRTITGNERVVDGVGYSLHLFGRVNAWKKAMTVLADDTSTAGLDAEGDTSTASAILAPINIMYLDQVDADAMAAVRFRLPTDRDTFLRMAHEYRSPENLLRVALIPSFQETLQATASLMSAEDYYSGGRTEFISEFENQMQNGIYLVKRVEVLKGSAKLQTSEADASDPANQDQFGDQQQTVFVVEKRVDPATGVPLRKEQKFTDFGITVHEARVTDMKPNSKFVTRMEQKQEASAKRAIAREQKIQEEEQRLLAIARGDREVAERQAAMKVMQIEATTSAETKRKEAVIEAERQRQQATIQEETAKILLSKARVDAEAVKVAAEAEAYRKEKILTADNALAQKLDAEIRIQEIWADAFAKRQVPQYVFSGAGGADAPVGSDMEVKHFMQLMTLDAAKRLSYDRDLARQ